MKAFLLLTGSTQLTRLFSFRGAENRHRLSFQISTEKTIPLKQRDLYLLKTMAVRPLVPIKQVKNRILSPIPELQET